MSTGDVLVTLFTTSGENEDQRGVAGTKRWLNAGSKSVMLALHLATVELMLLALVVK